MTDLNEEKMPDEIDGHIDENEKKQPGETKLYIQKKKMIITAVAVAAIGLIVYGVILFTNSSKVVSQTVTEISQGMTYDQVAKIMGKEEKKEELVVDGNDATMYTWPADLGQGEYTVSVIFIDDKVERVIQTTVNE